MKDSYDYQKRIVKVSSTSKKYHQAVSYFHGDMMFKSTGEQDYSKALSLFCATVNDEDAPKDEVAEAYNYIGVIYQNGLGVDVDLEKAFEAFEVASELGSWRGTEHLALKYYYGDGVDMDKSKAFKLFYIAWYHGTPSQHCLELVREEATKGDKDAQWCLGEIMYLAYQNSFSGEDFVQTYRWLYFWYTISEVKEAVKWLKLASEQGQENAIKAYQQLNIDGRTTTSVIIIVVLVAVIILWTFLCIL